MNEETTHRYWRKRKSGQIKPMTQKQLDASMRKLEKKQEKETTPGIAISRMPSGPQANKWKVVGTGPGVHRGGYREGEPEEMGEAITFYDTQADAEKEAKRLAEAFRLPYHGVQ